MISNNPLFLQGQDFHTKHADLIEAARAEPKAERAEVLGPGYEPYNPMFDGPNLAAELAAAKAEIDRLRIQLAMAKSDYEMLKVNPAFKVIFSRRPNKLSAAGTLQSPEVSEEFVTGLATSWTP